ncbi:MAG: UDP-N-acetylmuramoyl-L-alanyl-D-glutamate--2,6-diaminopimelate ligase [Nitrospirota bacterium]|nr:UDP-N-acetylmuramoyl-L-alanyl-D-glutamate--2,6-diaminopimelate ligase [Nitrospirota bacterium]
MRLATLLERARIALGGANADLEVGGVVYDSRRVVPGSLFVAITGFATDGHRFLAEAAKRGAVAAVVSRPVDDSPLPLVTVADTRAALADLSGAFHDDPTSLLTLVGITGTNGKTTTTYLVEGILDAAGYTTGVIGTVETRLAGTPLTLEGVAGGRTTPESSDLLALFAHMVGQGASACVMEVSSHALALSRVRGCHFDVAVFTNLTPDHLDFHHTMDEYFEAKSLLFRDLAPERAVINVDDPYGRTLAERLKTPLTFGLTPAATLHPTDLQWDRSGIRFTVRLGEKRLSVESPLVGLHNVHNLLSAIGAAHALGIEPEAIGSGLASARAVPGRLEPVDAGQAFTVLVDYAHTPDAIERLLEAVRPLVADRPRPLTTTAGRAIAPRGPHGGRVLVVFGAGGDRDATKRGPMGAAAARGADRIYITMDNPRSEDPAAICAAIEAGARAAASTPGAEIAVILDRETAIRTALAEARPGDLVLIAGKGHETTQTIGKTVTPFDDREVARRILAEVA